MYAFRRLPAGQGRLRPSDTAPPNPKPDASRAHTLGKRRQVAKKSTVAGAAAGRGSLNVGVPRPRTSAAAAAPAPGQPKTKMIVVYGFGCDKYLSDLERRERELLFERNSRKVYDVEVLCNVDEPRSMTMDIWLRLVKSGKQLEPTRFVKKVLTKVCRALDNGDKVILVGHSYGGSVASRVAMFLGHFCPSTRDLAKLRVVTFGSIFIPPPSATPGISVKHYAYDNDIAALCHKQTRACAHLQRLKPRPGRGPLGSHMNYDHLVLEVARTANTNLGARKNLNALDRRDHVK